jgi:hypothetical protein
LTLIVRERARDSTSFGRRSCSGRSGLQMLMDSVRLRSFRHLDRVCCS